MFSIIQFNEADGGGVSIVNSRWLTPRKREVFWPPIKDTAQFNKTVRNTNQSVDAETWTCYEISRIFYQCDNYEKARQKLKQAEETSDLNTDSEDPKGRKRIKPKRLLESSSEEEEQISKFTRPPKIKVTSSKAKEQVKVNHIKQNETHLEELSQTPTTSSSIGTPRRQLSYDNNDCRQTTHLLRQLQTENIIDELSTPRNTTATEDLPNIQNGNGGQKVLFKILEKLVKIEVQNEQIMNSINILLKNKPQTQITTSLPCLPVELPLSSTEEIQIIEEYLNDEINFSALKSYLASLGGSNITSRTNRILRQVITDNLASLYSFYGRKKRDFHTLLLSKAVICSVRFGIPDSTEKDIEDAIKVWLKHAPERLKKKEEKILVQNAAT